MRNLLFALLLAPLFISGCRKTGNNRNEFVINGIHDLSMGESLRLVVATSSGIPEIVTLSATGLPAGMNMTFSPASGLAGFSTIVTFNGGEVGTYPVRITGTSASCTRSYDFNLKVPNMNGWMVDGVSYKKGLVSKTAGVGYSEITATDETGNQQIGLFKSGTFPTADGTYTYQTGDATATDQVRVSLTDGLIRSYASLTSSTTTLTLVISGGKIRAILPSTLLTDGIITKTIIIDIKE